MIDKRIEDLDTSICDWSYQEGLTEIICNLKSIEIDTFAMNETSHAKLVGEKVMLEKIVDYLERCL